MKKHSIRDFDFKDKKNYVVGVSVEFTGKFIRYEEENGITYAVFEEKGVTDRGKTPIRRVQINNIVHYGLTKR